MNAAQRWTSYAVAALGTAGAMAWVDRRESAVPPVPRVITAAAKTAVRPRPGAAPAATLPRRSFTEPAGDPFAGGDAVSVAPMPAPAEMAPPRATPPAAPPLPYAYVGRWVENGSTVAFLTTQQGINVAARAGATLDATYLVEVVDAQGLTLKYLPLGQRQRLTFADGPAAPAAAPTGQALPTAVTEPEDSN
nr:hypothetical protein [uncultured Roseateles sp.]